MTHPAMAAVEGAGLAGQERPHGPGQRPLAGAEQAVRVGRREGPGGDGHRAGRDQPSQAAEDVGPIAGVAEDGAPQEPPHHDMLEDPGSIGPRGMQAAIT